MSLHNRGSLQKINDKVEFYTHQVEGIRTMCRLSSFLLADEMGLGKTLQALTVAAVDFERGYAHRVLVICPASLKWNWYDEIAGVDDSIDGPRTYFKAMVLDGTPAQRQDQLFDFDNLGYELLIVNYEQVKAHGDALNKLRFDIGIWDEAHYLKNPKSKRTKASHGLLIPRRFLLTGSPMLNQVNELWSLLHLIDPDRWPRYWSFVNRYCVFGGWKNKEVTGVKNKVELMGILETVMIRRLKKDVLKHLPPKRNIVVKVDLTPEQRALYEEAKEELRMTMDDVTLEIDNPLVKFLRLKEVCGSTYKFTGEDHSSKLDRAEEMTVEYLSGSDKPIVIFTQFRTTIERMKVRLERNGITVFEIHGDVPKDQRVEVIKRWAAYTGKDGRRAAIVVGLQAGGVGLNMTAADTCIFLDKLFVPKLNEQAEDRLHRIGATGESITIYEMVCRNTIESRIEAILRGKRKLFDSVVETTDWKKTISKALMEAV